LDQSSPLVDSFVSHVGSDVEKRGVEVGLQMEGSGVAAKRVETSLPHSFDIVGVVSRLDRLEAAFAALVDKEKCREQRRITQQRNSVQVSGSNRKAKEVSVPLGRGNGKHASLSRRTSGTVAGGGSFKASALGLAEFFFGVNTTRRISSQRRGGRRR
jgi:hypothetical protein